MPTVKRYNYRSGLVIEITTIDDRTLSVRIIERGVYSLPKARAEVSKTIRSMVENFLTTYKSHSTNVEFCWVFAIDER